MKRFIDLQPEFVSSNKSIGENRKGTAVWSLCPCGCSLGCIVPLRNPLDGGPPDPLDAWGHITDRWLRKGEDLATITFEPSVLIWEDKEAGKQHWHGHITKGIVT